MSRLSIFAAAAALLFVAGCLDQRVIDAINETPDFGADVVLDGPEALAWLKSNKNESALASNRFMETENAVKFVEALYAAGAVKVIVPTDAIISDEDIVLDEGGPYADALVVTLPDEPGARRAVLRICRAELRREGFDSSDVAEAEQVYLWWD
jgi:hypothetical protein